MVGGLISVTIGNSVASIGEFAFYECVSLTSVHITDLAAWCKINFEVQESPSSNPLAYANHLYLNGEEIKDLVIPNSVTSIGEFAFANCSGLTSVTIPNSVASIGENAFQKCYGLTSVTACMKDPIQITSSTFSNRQNATLYVPIGSKAAYEAADYWKEFKEINEVEMPEEPATPGDLNGDGKVNVGDIMAIINIMADGGKDLKGDVNGDGAVNVGDIMAIINIMAGK